MDSAFSLPTLLIIVPAAGGLIAMSMLTRRAAAVTSLVTFLVQAALLVVALVQVGRYREAFGASAVASCDAPASAKGARLVLAQCSDWFPGWGVQYHVALGYGSLALVALTTLVVAGACTFSWWADRTRPAAVHGLLWLTAASLTGLFVARDLVLFYVFFELMLVPLLVLVGVWGGVQRIRASLTMFIYTLLGSLPMLVGVVATGLAAERTIAADPQRWTAQEQFSLPQLASMVHAGELHLSTWVLASFLLAFAIKAPLLPFHGWLPISYRQAPVEVTAVLSGLISKAAFFGMFVIVLPLFPSQLAGGWGTGLTWLALASLLFGSLAAFRQPDLRGVVAYSSLGQMGLIFLGLSAFTGAGSDQALGGAYLQTINHGLLSAAAFLLVGIVEVRSGETDLAKLGGLATGRARLASIGLLVTLVMLAVPGASTFAGELLILAGAFRGDVSGPLVASLGVLAVVFAAMYSLRWLAGFAFSDRATTSEDARAANERFGGDLSWRELLVVGPVLVALVALSAWPNLLHRAMNDAPVRIERGADPLVAAADHAHATAGDAKHTEDAS